VLDELTDYHGKPSGSLAVKFGSGSLNWAFVGYTRMYTGVPESVSSTSDFNLDIESSAGFWLNDNEVVIVQIISGPGAGESRKVKYNKTSAFEVLEKPFSALTAQSNLSIWRSYKNLLPTRSPEIPDYFMLQKGLSNWCEQVVESASGALNPFSFSLVGNGTNTVTIPASIVSSLSVDTSAGLATIHKNGALVGMNNYALLYNSAGKPDRIQFSSVNTTLDKIDVLIFGYDYSDGASLYWYESEYDAVGTTSFPLPVIPSSTSGIIAYLDSVLVTNFSIVGANLEFSSPVLGKLEVLCVVNYSDTGVMPKLKRWRSTTVVGQHSVDTQATIAAKKDTLVYVNSAYVPKSEYSIQDNRYIVFSSPLGAGTVETFVYYSEIVEPTVVSTTGRDSGPRWADPAGVNAASNSIVAYSYQGVTDSALTSFTTERVNNESYLFVFVSGSYQYPNQYMFTQFTDRSVIRLNEVLPAGLDVDIIAFKEVPGPGSLIKGIIHRFALSASTTYTLPLSLSALPSSYMLFIGGVYQHRINYDLNHTTGVLTLYNMPAGMAGTDCEFQYFTSVEEPGVRTDFGTYISSLNTTVGRNRLSFPVEDANDTLVFVGSVYQNKDQYVTETLTQGQPTGYANWVPDTNVSENGTEVCTVSIQSVIPPTRLLLRSEFEECCNSIWDVLNSGNFGGGGASGGATTSYSFTAVAGQTYFILPPVTISDHIAVLVRGVELAPDDYIRSGSSIVLQGIALEAGTPVVLRDFGAVAEGSSTYELPVATPTVLGGVKVGLGLAITPAGVLSATGGSSGGSSGGSVASYIAGTDTFLVGDQVGAISLTIYTAKVSYRVPVDGVITTRTSVSSVRDGYTAYVQIYKNGAAVGAEHSSSSSTSSPTWDENITVAAGDLVQLYTRSSPVPEGYLARIALYTGLTTNFLLPSPNQPQ